MTDGSSVIDSTMGAADNLGSSTMHNAEQVIIPILGVLLLVAICVNATLWKRYRRPEEPWHRLLTDSLFVPFQADWFRPEGETCRRLAVAITVSALGLVLIGLLRIRAGS